MRTRVGTAAAKVASHHHHQLLQWGTFRTCHDGSRWPRTSASNLHLGRRMHSGSVYTFRMLSIHSHNQTRRSQTCAFPTSTRSSSAQIFLGHPCSHIVGRGWVQVYSDQLKNITGFTQDEIQTVASTGNIGLYFAIVAGLVFDKVVRVPCPWHITRDRPVLLVVVLALASLTTPSYHNL